MWYPNEPLVAIDSLVPLLCELSPENSHFTVVYLVAKPLIWSEAERNFVVIETGF